MSGLPTRSLGAGEERVGLVGAGHVQHRLERAFAHRNGAIVVIGPKGLPEAMRTLGRALAKLRPGYADFHLCAGHGSQEPARPNDLEKPDGLDENFPLVNCRLGPAMAERIIDN